MKSNNIILVILFIALSNLGICTEIKVGISEKDLIEIKGDPLSSMRGPKKSILNWPDLKAEVVEGKVSALIALSPQVDAPIGKAESEIMLKLIALHKKAEVADGISKSDYLTTTAEIINFFKENQSEIKNKKFEEACSKYLNAVILFRNMLSLGWEKTDTKEPFYYVRKDRNLEIYNLVGEIPLEERKKGIEPRFYPSSFEVYEAHIVYNHINNKYFFRLAKMFMTNSTETALDPSAAK